MKVAVLGASGLVGRTMLELLAECEWVDQAPLPLTSERSAGQVVPFRGDELTCRAVTAEELEGLDIALFSAGAAAAREYAPLAAEAGVWVIDNSSAWRQDSEVALVVPEINAHRLPEATGSCGGIIANPNCSTIQIAMALAPLHEAVGLKEVHVTTLQAVSGAGQAGVAELTAQIGPDGAGVTGEKFPRRIAFNAIPEIGPPEADGSFNEEAKVERELRKILEIDTLPVTCTATRVPVWHGHSVAARVILDGPVDCRQLATTLARSPGLEVSSDPHEYLTAVEISGRKTVHVGRLRRDPNRPDALLCWIVADNILKGAAWNAVQIAESVVKAGQS